ncbi:hypothetical protein [Paracoccus laeviglucosivorans]|uniref:Uncharacterized protein n=1 Tax=Paracoccus laeviglucosivorans TaxID=1197861 RepID=A0A521DWY1_9RHOB|nr:hypothetical protein [Paracoccus laeviglucosivorans]SMO76249.1 hypothetical protein SAMN06265221_11071 [Paracoccus laeviglucosivorans]
MIDLLLLAGIALCAISVIMAIVSVARTEAPRGAALALVLGIVALFATTLLDQRPLGLESVTQSWQRLIGGESFGADTSVTAPPAVVGQGTDAPAASEPAPQAGMQDGEREPAPPGVEGPAESSATSQ